MKKEPEIWDIYQIILAVLAGISFMLTAFSYVSMSKFIMNHIEEIEAETIEVPLSYSIMFTIGLSFLVCFGAWLIIRYVTFKYRKREYLLEQNKE